MQSEEFPLLELRGDIFGEAWIGISWEGRQENSRELQTPLTGRNSKTQRKRVLRLSPGLLPKILSWLTITQKQFLS
jgi:hypothetical protein